MQQVLSYLKSYRKWMIAAWLLMFIELIVELWQPLLMEKIIDNGVMAKNFSVVWTWGAVMLGTSLLAFASGIANSFAAAYVGQEYGFLLRKRLFEKIQSFSFADFERFPTASLITRMTNDVTQIQNMVFMSLRIALRAPLLVLFGVVMSFAVHVQLALVCAVTVPLLVAFLLWMMTKAAASFSIVQQALDRVNRVMRENLAGMRLIKAWMRGTYEQKRFMKENEALMERTISALRLVETITPALLLMMNVAVIIILFIGRVDVQSGSATAGQVVAIVNYTTRITAALSMFTFITMAFSRAKASAERVADVLRVNVDVEDAQQATDKVSGQGEVRFEHVSFRYPNSRALVLKDISFVVHPHETVAILGATGSGKSSLLQLIPRLYDPVAGRVMIDGVDVRHIKQEQLRAFIRFVPQEVLLFSGTIAENIRFGNEHASMEEIIQAAKHAQIHDTIMKFPDGYDTVIGQRGVNLSGGQKQRLSIARALVGMPKILLLDDSTSALDLKTEAKLLRALKAYTCTTLIVTQKIQTAMEADTIFLLDDGKLLAKGSHDELLEKSEIYRKIVESQFGKKGT
ncbi:ABC transporter ATP-binding protein [Parageobacillus thermoglucosidasius]|uniref:ABC transporter ATP-binding protein n=1 Tax=Parageobacillus thermoglucosidasius TaxID=1426 RepID=A0AAN0YR41_PARTM|nr:ABC transporter ATP-binding protein [Parageobacillus thermoglucosidasius]ALF10982.1 ABC transporter ATP-binding protein [Parageobacillus thermoglucosidasius]ANZ31059.1 ABC transporter ATP-binding protein [Parageobacillus thermoglucosidasius]APM81796.1 ABC transporter ATP-binding protein [Parageobacillus thermoglucosidasius]KJX69252.1 ABC transporter ATP-binding protein [Parageobacillus thermoglucosidasius]RDE25535.1 ABC transporter ATP-binding protein [Parageobacillus thermoglucosidasius]